MTRDHSNCGDSASEATRRVNVDLSWGRLPLQKQASETSRTVYVFVSSTFRDMHAERDYLSQVVFPRLRSLACLYGIHIDEIDLRAGVTEWLFASGSDPLGILHVCKQQIERCRPFFICLLGQRYGTTVERIGRSITHFEVDRAIELRDHSQEGVLFFFRDPSYVDDLPPHVRDTVYVETDPTAARALESLKQTIRVVYGNCLVSDGYSARWDSHAYDWPTAYDALSPVKGRGRLVGLDRFGDAAKQSLWRAIRRRLNLPQKPSLPLDPLSRERNEHSLFAAYLEEGYVERCSVQAHLGAAVESGGVTVLLGGQGSGKTSLLAAVTRSLMSKNDCFLVTHFVGAAPFSKSFPHTLWRIAAELDRLSQGPRQDGPGLAKAEHERRFAQALADVPRDVKVAVVLDGIDEFDTDESFQLAALIPAVLPSNITILLSCVPGLAADGLMQRAHRIIEVCPLSLAEREELLRRQSLLSKRLLGPDGISALLQSPGASYPLFLRLAAPYVLLNAIGYESSSLLCQDAANLAGSNPHSYVDGIIHAILVAVENSFGTDILANLFGLLCSTRRALDEVELHEVMTAIDSSSNQILPVLFALRRYMPRRGTRIEPLHNAILAEAAKRYITTEASIRMNQQVIADYYLAKPHWIYPEGASQYRIPNFRKLEELPRLLRELNRMTELQELIQDREWRELRKDWLGSVAAEEDVVIA